MAGGSIAHGGGSTSVPGPHRFTKTELGLTESAKADSGVVPMPTGLFPSISPPSAAAGQLTPEQVAHLIFEHQQAQKNQGGFLDEVKSGVLGLGGEALAGIGNVISRPLWGVTHGVDVATRGKTTFNPLEFFEGIPSGLTGEHKETFGQLLAKRHILDDHTIIRGGLGLGLDLVADPLNYALLAATPFAPEATVPILAEELGADVAKVGLTRALEEAAARKGALEGLGAGGKAASLREIVDIAKTQHAEAAKGLDEFFSSEIPGQAGRTFGDIKHLDEWRALDPEMVATRMRLLHDKGLADMIAKTATKLQPHVIRPHFWLPTLTGGKMIPMYPASIAGRRVAPYAPTILNLAEKRGALSHLPGAVPAARFIQDKFKPGWEDPLTHLVSQARDYNVDSQRSFLAKRLLKPFIDTLARSPLDEESKRRALDVAAGPEGAVHELRGGGMDEELQRLVERGVEEGGLAPSEGQRMEELMQSPITERQFNPDHLRAEGLDEHQISYLKTWHDMFEYLRRYEKELGVPMAENVGGRLYVPRIGRASEVGDFVQRSALKGFQHERQVEESTPLQELERQNVEQGLKGDNAHITSPADIIEHRLLASAHAISTSTFRRNVGNVFTIPSTVVDVEKTAAKAAEYEVKQAEHAEHVSLGDQIPADHAAQEEELARQNDQAVSDYEAQIHERVAAIDAGIEQLRQEQAADATRRALHQAEPGKVVVHDTTGVPAEMSGRRAGFYDPDKNELHVATGEVTHGQLAKVAKMPRAPFRLTQVELRQAYPEHNLAERWTVHQHASDTAMKAAHAGDMGPVNDELYRMVRTLQEHRNVPVYEQGSRTEFPARDVADQATEAERKAAYKEAVRTRRVRTRAQNSLANAIESHVHEDAYGVADAAAAEKGENLVEQAEAKQLLRQEKVHADDVKRLEREEKRLGRQKVDLANQHGHLANASDEHVHAMASDVAMEFNGVKDGLLEDLNAEFEKLAPQTRAPVKAGKLEWSKDVPQDLTRSATAQYAEGPYGLRLHLRKVGKEYRLSWGRKGTTEGWRSRTFPKLSDAKAHAQEMVSKELAEAPQSKAEALVAMESDRERDLASLRLALRRVNERAGEMDAAGNKIRSDIEKATDKTLDDLEWIRFMKGVEGRPATERDIGRWKEGFEFEGIPARVLNAKDKADLVAKHERALRQSRPYARMREEDREAWVRDQMAAYDPLTDIPKETTGKYHIIREFKKRGLDKDPHWQAALRATPKTAIESSKRDGLLQTIQDVEKAQSPEDLMHILGPDHPRYDQLRQSHEAIEAFKQTDIPGEIDRLASAAEDAATQHAEVRRLLGHTRGRQTRFLKKNAAALEAARNLPARMATRKASKETAITAFQASERKLARANERHIVAQADALKAEAELQRLGGIQKGPPPRHYERSIKAQQDLRQRILDKAPDKLARLAQPGHRRMARMRQSLEKGRAAYDRETAQREARLEAAQAELENGYTRLHPMLKDGRLVRHDSLPGRAMPPDIHAALNRYEQPLKDVEGWNDVAKAARKVMSRWKLFVTAASPLGYRIRNTISDIWNAYISGVPLRAMPIYLARASRLMEKARRGDSEAVFKMMEMEMHGVTQGLFGGDVQRALYELHEARPVRGALRGHPLQWYVRGMTSFNRWGENVGRVAHMMWRLDHGSKSVADAAWEVRRAHFDYADLTTAERKIKDFAVPFYTWTRKNVPYQVVQLLSRPGRVQGFYSLAQESETASGSHRGELIPSFFRDNGGFRVPGLGPHTYLLPQIGLLDLGRVTTLRGLLGMAGPQYQIGEALATGVNPFTGAKIRSDTHEFTPTNSVIASIVGAIAPGLAGQTERAVGKRHVSSAGINPMLNYLLGETGLPGLRYLMGRNPVSEAENPAINRALSTFAGLPVYDANQDEEKMLAQLKDDADFKKFMRVLRDQPGGYPESKRRKVSPNQARLNQLIFASRGRP